MVNVLNEIKQLKLGGTRDLHWFDNTYRTKNCVFTRKSIKSLVAFARQIKKIVYIIKLKLFSLSDPYICEDRFSTYKAIKWNYSTRHSLPIINSWTRCTVKMQLMVSCNACYAVYRVGALIKGLTKKFLYPRTMSNFVPRT